jgi:NADH-quinone oxidoreductase subunit C
MTIRDLAAKFADLLKAAPVSPAAGDAGTAPTAAAVAPAVETDHAKRGIDLEVTVAAKQVVAAARLLDEAGYMLEAITGVDWLAEKQIEIVYDFTHFGSGQRVAVRTRVAREKPEVPTICRIHPGANWHERETHDLVGVLFSGHPDMSPLLLPEDAKFHPLRKDFGV